MCMFKSGIILKDEVFVPDYDSHTDMLSELKIKDTEANARKLFVRAELLPPCGNVFIPIDEWIFKVDQDIRPDWFVEEYEKERMREAVKKWAVNHIHIGKDNLVINSGGGHCIKDCKNVVVCDSATVKEVCGSATVKEVCDSATVKEVCDSATINYVYGSATVNKVCGSATVKEVCGSATVNYVYGSATVNYVYGSATVNKVCDSAMIASSSYGWANKEKVVISENATFKDNSTKTIWQSGDWTVKIIGKDDK